MGFLSKRSKNRVPLSDLLPWIALVASGVVLNKDDSLQSTIAFRGPDLESVTEEQLVVFYAKLNNIFKRFSSGWVLYIEMRRELYFWSTESSHFSDPITLLIDEERNNFFLNGSKSFENKYYLTLQCLPSTQKISKISDRFFLKSKQKIDHSVERIDLFRASVKRFFDLFKDLMVRANFLNDEETLAYLHSTISNKYHPIALPTVPLYLDKLLSDTCFIGGMALKLGDQHLRVISILSFPTATLPNLLETLNHLPFTYRWITRFVPLDREEAGAEIKRYRRYWFSKRKKMVQILQEIFTRSESQLYDSDALNKSHDANLALEELSDDAVTYGYYTGMVIVKDEDLERVLIMQREVERAVNSLGFVTIAETFNGVEAWLSSLPGHCYANVRSSLLHSLNLVHLLPFSAIWSGPKSDEHLKAPPLIYLHTCENTPFRLVNHVGDVGHKIVVGPTGSGKSVLLIMLALQFCRYQNAQIFIFDKGESFLAATLGVGGDFYKLESSGNNLSFQPLGDIEDDQEMIWAFEWILGLLLNEEIVVTIEIKRLVWEALNSLKALPAAQRTLTSLRVLIQDNLLRQTLSAYTLEGPYGYLFDANEECFSRNFWHCYEIGELLYEKSSVVAPLLTYLFHRLERFFTGSPTLLILDEAWVFLDHPLFASRIRNWLKSLRKRNVSVIFATQSVDDLLTSSIATVLLESCKSRIFLPNDRILEPQICSLYEKLGLNSRQIETLATATSKRHYYYESSLGNRLFELQLGPISLAFCTANSQEDRRKIRNIYKKFGRYNFLKHYLLDKKLNWVLDEIYGS